MADHKQILKLLDEITEIPKHRYNIKEVAKKAGVTRVTVYDIMKKYQHPRQPKTGT